MRRDRLCVSLESSLIKLSKLQHSQPTWDTPIDGEPLAHILSVVHQSPPAPPIPPKLKKHTYMTFFAAWEPILRPLFACKKHIFVCQNHSEIHAFWEQIQAQMS